MFRIKICGITNVEDALVAADAGADAIGLNFYEKSPRFVTADKAKAIVAPIPYDVARVGVFVNATLGQIDDRSDKGSTFWDIQLHGDESLEIIKQVAEHYEVIRVRRLTSEPHATLVDEELDEYCDVVGFMPAAYLVDAAAPGVFGGTGKTLAWDRLVHYSDRLKDNGLSLILAGGLTPDNVAEAIRIVKPHGVDVASGVESAPGKKDPAKVRDFVAAALAAFEALGSQTSPDQA